MQRTFKKGAAFLGGIGLAAGIALAAVPAQAQDAVKLGAGLAITGPVQGEIPPMLDAIRLAVQQVNDQGGILDGRKLEIVTADTQCNPQAAVAAMSQLINVDRVAAVVGPVCSGALIAAANAQSIPAGVVIVSPSATSPNISDIDDKDTVFRTTPHDAQQGAVLARALLDRGIKKVALTFVNNDYGQPLANSFRTAYTKGGGEIAGDQPHEDKTSSDRSELATLARGGAPYLVVIGYPQSSAPVIMRQALEAGHFKRFAGPEALNEDKLLETIGLKNLEGMLMTTPGSPAGPAFKAYQEAFQAFKKESFGSIFTPQSYDAAFVLALAIQKAGSTDRAAIRKALREVANPPGETILPGEWKKAVELIKAGKDINYQGATGDVDFDEKGDVGGLYDVILIRDGKKEVIATY